MSNTVEKGFFFPLGLIGAGVSDERKFCGATTETLNDPNAFDARQINIQNTSSGEAVREQRLGFFDAEAVDNTVLFRI